MFLPGLKAPGVFCFLQHVSFFLVITAIFLADTRKCATAVADDKFCLLTGKPSRDPADTRTFVNLRRQQICKMVLPTPTTNPALFTYTLNKDGVWVVTSGIVRITAANLDTGSDPVGPSQSVYTDILNGHFVQQLPTRVDKTDPLTLPPVTVGQILGKTLGGPGNDLVNIFPQAPKHQDEYLRFEKTIHDCLLKKQAEKVTLRWLFFYTTTSDTRPYKLTYRANFEGGPLNPPCTVLYLSLDN